MFDIGATELLLVAMVALIVIGPKDLPLAMRTAGRWIGQLRKMTGHFRVGIDAMIREAEIEEQEKAWAEKNAEIMREHPSGTVPQGEGDAKAEPAPETPPETQSERPPAVDTVPPAPAGDGDDTPESKS